eukprot:5977725-Prorocentrum_lima.AAC.1
MTSSLVGSEMCIRDRQQNAQPQQTKSPTKNHRHEPPPHNTDQTNNIITCLLYTSDAADDM